MCFKTRKSEQYSRFNESIYFEFNHGNALGTIPTICFGIMSQMPVHDLH